MSVSKKIAVSYFRDRANITDEKLDVLDMNSQDIKLIYIADVMNEGVEGQFPEWLMKIQSRQGFCLFLSIDGVDYEKARLDAVLYDQDIDGLWCEIPVTDGMLSEYDFDEDNNLILRGESLDSMYNRAWYEFRKKQDLEHDRRVKQQEEAEAERKRKQEEQQRLKEEYERKQREHQEEQKRLKEDAEAEKHMAAEEFVRNMAAGFEQQETQITDENGVRWIKCEFCGKIAPVKEFSSYGGPNHINLGTCMECSRNNPSAAVEITIPQRTKQRFDPNTCPECGSRLIERNGRRGRFMGCSGYPRCRYTRPIR